MRSDAGDWLELRTGPRRLCHSPAMDFGVWGPEGELSPAGVAVIGASGELDIGSVPILEAVLAPAVSEGGQVILDGTDLKFTDSTGVTLFVRAHRDAMEAGGRLDLVLVEKAVLRVLELAGLIGVLNVHASVDLARRAC